MEAKPLILEIVCSRYTARVLEGFLGLTLVGLSCEETPASYPKEAMRALQLRFKAVAPLIFCSEAPGTPSWKYPLN